MPKAGSEGRGFGDNAVAESIRRRTFLSTVGLVGVTATAGRVGATQESENESDSESETDSDADGENEEPQWPEPDDEYYQTLVDDLSEMDLPPAEFVHGDTEDAAFSQYWASTGDEESYGASEDLDVSGDDVPFSKAMRFTVEEVPPEEWNVQLRTADWHSDPYRSVESGDVMLGVAYLRAPEGEGEIQYAVENTQSTQWNSVVNETRQYPDDEWARYYFPVELAADANGSEFEWTTQLHFGAAVQTIDVGGVAFLDFDQRVSTAALPAGASDGDPEEDSPEGENEDSENGDDETEQDETDGENGDSESEQEATTTDQSGQETDGGLTDSVPGLGIVSGLAGLGAAAGHLLSRVNDDGGSDTEDR